jgi:hypothetical protein
MAILKNEWLTAIVFGCEAATLKHNAGIDGRHYGKIVLGTGKIIVQQQLRLYKEFTNGIFWTQE